MLLTEAEREARREREAYEWRTTVNLLAAIVILLLFSAGLFLLNGVVAANKSLLCVESGSRKCQKLDQR